MAAVKDKVMALVERELKKNPAATSKELYEKAKKAEKTIGRLSIRQFHARYPLQAKRKLAPPKRRTRAAPKRRQPQRRGRKGVDRAAIRDVFLKFARDLAAAEGKYEAIDVLTGVDRYVDEVIEAV